MKKAHKIMKEIEALEKSVAPIPYEVWTTFMESPNYSLYGSQVCFGGDFKTLEQTRSAIEWLVVEFGGKVKWGK
jgi:BRCT domain type II-containing protein